MSRKYGIKFVFFDGRGGPPARGGGKTHKFYASLGTDIENSEIQVTIQGQTISSNFGTAVRVVIISKPGKRGHSQPGFDKGKNNLSEEDKARLTSSLKRV